MFFFILFVGNNNDSLFSWSSLNLIPDLKLHLQTTDYGNFLANETGPLTISTIDDKLKAKLLAEFHYFRNHAFEPLATFLNFIT